jgi:hypothetical protein
VVIDNIDRIVGLLSAQKIIPSNQVILWSLQLAGIKHFGNDFGFHNSVHSALNSLSIENDINSLQLTLPKKDGLNFVEFDKVTSYHVQQYMDKKRIVKTPTKATRVNDITNLYLHLGDKVINYWDDYNRTGKTVRIPMGRII